MTSVRKLRKEKTGCSLQATARFNKFVQAKAYGKTKSKEKSPKEKLA